MERVARQLRLKYGLNADPSNANILRWAEEVRSLDLRGYRYEEGGEIAAKLIFPDFKAQVTKSEADTVETLLREIGRK
jgi:hypothetical protein